MEPKYRTSPAIGSIRNKLMSQGTGQVQLQAVPDMSETGMTVPLI